MQAALCGEDFCGGGEESFLSRLKNSECDPRVEAKARVH